MVTVFQTESASRKATCQRNGFPLDGARCIASRFDTLNFSHFVNFQHKRKMYEKKRTDENKSKSKTVTTK